MYVHVRDHANVYLKMYISTGVFICECQCVWCVRSCHFVFVVDVYQNMPVYM